MTLNIEIWLIITRCHRPSIDMVTNGSHRDYALEYSDRKMYFDAALTALRHKLAAKSWCKALTIKPNKALLSFMARLAAVTSVVALFKMNCGMVKVPMTIWLNMSSN
ncbi:uncharacterized protein PHALS_04693 [Plasmopara halstedii]|uniref:Uncharacterized protein n=1 Tax=Plasmopara halstedii TaxID=4781 RepID=A0A0P1AAH5_PLAHL|nr:uncharacterized protein PHALS_04693 [Plasmopara halstedii]CEG37252.1 hypothetical protein PHALS_04693 [Plasmopara halstedii]|eukprot:XP_024573621.1 hypothetical protein PHALS_04693 [Plasmopara halstedii]